VAADLDAATSVSVECNYCAFSLPAGWRLRVAVSQTYWPVFTPSSAKAGELYSQQALDPR